MISTLTDRQRYWLEHVHACEANALLDNGEIDHASQSPGGVPNGTKLSQTCVSVFSLLKGRVRITHRLIFGGERCVIRTLRSVCCMKTEKHQLVHAAMEPGAILIGSLRLSATTQLLL